MALRRRGMTITETVIYVAISCVLAVLVGSLFILARRNSENTNVNYFLTADTETAISWLRRDLQQSALTTIQVFPSASNSTQPPGASWASAMDAENPQQLEVNDTGNPNWRTHVYYTLQANKDNSGKLVRWTRRSGPAAGSTPTPGSEPLNTPTLGTLSPGSPSAPTSSRVVHNRVLMPNSKLFGVGSDGSLDKHGGFRVQFVRRNREDGPETLSDDNPTVFSRQKNSNAFESNTRLVQVDLKFATSSSTGKGNFYAVTFRVCPLY